MIISIDNHVGLPFLEGLCDDLQDQIRKHRASKLRKESRSKRVLHAGWQFAVTKVATVACAISGGLVAVLALLELHASL